MRRTILATVASLALLATTASAAAALPENGNAYGKGVKFHCADMPYGQLVKQAPAGHPVVGAKKFITQDLALLQAHGCFLD